MDGKTKLSSCAFDEFRKLLAEPLPLPVRDSLSRRGVWELVDILAEMGLTPEEVRQ